ncbi:MAG: hypothetical protein ABSG68_15440 [Thermoguttaceae bacterium]
MLRSMVLGGVVSAMCLLAAPWSAVADEKAPEKPKSQADKPEVKWTPAVTPKPLSEQVKRGMNWLVEHQLQKGAWGQGEESAHMGGGSQMKDVPSVADTCMAALALIRAGNTPAQGEYAANVLRAVEFVCGQIEESDKDSLYVTPTRGTRVQGKLGPYIDTFTCSLLLAEVKARMPDAGSQKRVAAALDKLLVKIQKNQRADGTWGGEGWATTLQQNMAVKGLNRVVQNGAGMVDDKVRERSELQARQSFDRASGKFSAAGSAGVELYSAGANLSNIAQNATTNALQESKVRAQAMSAPTPAARREAQRTIARFEAVKKDQSDAEHAVIARLDDKQFIAGFGSNGGEEFLSYMNIGESLVVKGGDTWKSWDKSISQNLDRVQNSDGSWSGHHCITGRTFCTAAALLVLMVDRSPQPISEKMKQR